MVPPSRPSHPHSHPVFADNRHSPVEHEKVVVRSKNEWSGKVMMLLKAGNAAAAIAQIKVAPSVKDLNALRKALVDANLTGRWRDVDAAIEENHALLSAPRLHRAP